METQGSGRRKDINPLWYRDNSLSKGGQLKAENLVVEGSGVRKQPNLNCKIEAFGQVMHSFSAIKQRWVTEMGFQGLFSLVGKGLPRNFCYWLASRVDVPSRTFVSPNGVEFMLNSVQVNWVFGLPIGGDPVPNEFVSDHLKEKVNLIWDKYVSTSPKGTKGICRRKVLAAVKSDAIGENDFKESFLMLALMDVVCPTTCHRLGVKMFAAAAIAGDAAKFDWCSYLLDHLLDCIRKFANRFYVDGYSKGCGGCLMFLAVVYADKLKRPPVSWGVWPRLSAWSKKELNKAKLADMLPSRDYGKLGIFDVAYGEKHPLEARDTLCSPMPNISEHQLGRFINANDVSHLNNGRYKRKTDVKNPWDYKRMKEMELSGFCDELEGELNDQHQYTSVDHGPPVNVGEGCEGSESELNDQHQYTSVDHGPLVNVGEGCEGLESEVDGGSDSHDKDEGGIDFHGEGGCSPSVVSHDVHSDGLMERSRTHRKIKPRISEQPMKLRYLKCMSSLIKSIHVSPFCNMLESDPIVFQCHGIKVKWSAIQSVVTRTNTLCHEYVRVASHLYGKVWNVRHVGRSVRYMFEPDFAEIVLQYNGDSLAPLELFHGFVDRLKQPENALLAAAQINVVFVPVFENGRWWCVIFCFNRKEVVVVDSSDPNNAVDLHHLSVMKLTYAMDELLKLFDPTWVCGDFTEWRKFPMGVVGGGDWDSGVLMLKVIKLCHDRLLHECILPNFNEGLTAHFCEDLFADYNEAKADIQQFVRKLRKTSN